MTSAAATCPNCDSHGEVGQPCPERGCQKRGYCFIPDAYAEKLAASSHASMEPMIGQMVGEYLVVDVLGQGGFGKVYLALQMPIQMETALKLMDRAGIQQEATANMLLRKFQGEAQALAQLFHPNIVRLLKYGAHNSIPYLVMEYVKSGRTLKGEIQDFAQRGARLSSGVIHQVLRQVVDALDAAHQLAIVHRDIKPENIMLQSVAGNDHLVRILDFGLAKFVADRAETSVAMGTPIYMAPEQWSRQNIGPWTDLYALGVMTFEMMTGRKPFPGRTQQEILARKLDPQYDPTSQIAEMGVPDYVQQFLRRATRRDPRDRYQNAEEYRAGLESVFERLASEPDVAMSDAVDVSGLLHDELGGVAAAAISSPDDPTNLLGKPAPLSTGRAGPTGTERLTSDFGAEWDAGEPPSAKKTGLWIGLAAAAVLAAGVGIGLAMSGSGGGTTAPTAQVAKPAGAVEAKEAAAKDEPAPEPDEADEPEPPAAKDEASTEPEPPAVDPEAAASPAPEVAEAAEEESAAPPTAPEPPAEPPAAEPPPPPPPPPRFTVTVASNPAEALVFKGDEPLGKTPTEVSWEGDAGPTLTLKAEGHEDSELTLVVADAGQTKTVDLVKVAPPPPPPKPVVSKAKKTSRAKKSKKTAKKKTPVAKKKTPVAKKTPKAKTPKPKQKSGYEWK